MAEPKCIGCGYCCDSGPCPVAVWYCGLRSLWKWNGCPFLFWNGERYRCAKHNIRFWFWDDRCIMPENPRRRREREIKGGRVRVMGLEPKADWDSRRGQDVIDALIHAKPPTGFKWED